MSAPSAQPHEVEQVGATHDNVVAEVDEAVGIAGGLWQ